MNQLIFLKEEPYVMKDNKTLKFSGYSIDLLDKVAVIDYFYFIN